MPDKARTEKAAAVMGRKARDRHGGGSSWLRSDAHWRPVAVDDTALLLEGGEGGFAGLEVLTNTDLLTLPSHTHKEKGANAARTRNHALLATEENAFTTIDEKRDYLQGQAPANASTTVKTLEAETGVSRKRKSKQQEFNAKAKQASKKSAKPLKKEDRRKEHVGLDLQPLRKKVRRDLEGAKMKMKQASAPKDDTGADGTVRLEGWAHLCLHSRLEKGLADLQFFQPTAIQRAAFVPATLYRRDIIGEAQTGSGKTLAFGLPILQVLLQEYETKTANTIADTASFASNPEKQHSAASPSAAAAGARGALRALVLVPTRELALQVSSHLSAFRRYCQIQTIPVVGGMAQVKQVRLDACYYLFLVSKFLASLVISSSS